MELSLCYLYPEMLNLYGDQGNIITLQKRCEWRDISITVTGVDIDDDVDLSQFDMFFVGGGQDFDQTALINDLQRGGSDSKASQLSAAIENDVPLLAICGGYQILGEYYRSPAGERFDFIGALPFYTEGAQTRMIGNLLFEATSLINAPTVVGFENHAGKTYLSEDLKPLGKVISGFGNNGEDGFEGVRYRNVMGTYSHGPLLPKNPAVADELISLALHRKYEFDALAPLDDSLEKAAHDAMETRLRSL